MFTVSLQLIGRTGRISSPADPLSGRPLNFAQWSTVPKGKGTFRILHPKITKDKQQQKSKTQST